MKKKKVDKEDDGKVGRGFLHKNKHTTTLGGHSLSYIMFTIDLGIGWTVKAGISEEPRAHLFPAFY